MTTDIDQINEARSRYNARKTESSLIEWICCADWTFGPKYEHARGDARGSVVAKWGNDQANTISGEIEIARFPAWSPLALGDTL